MLNKPAYLLMAYLREHLMMMAPAGLVFSGNTSCTSTFYSSPHFFFSRLISSTNRAGFVTISRNESAFPLVVFLSRSERLARITSIDGSSWNLLLSSSFFRLSYISEPHTTFTCCFLPSPWLSRQECMM